jgi:hypothetical protein
MEGPKGFRALLAPWTSAGFVTIVEDEIRFWNGSKIYLCHCKDPKDIYKYRGAEIHALLIDELTHFLEPMYRFLRSRVRMVGLEVSENLKGKFPRILCGANPATSDTSSASRPSSMETMCIAWPSTCRPSTSGAATSSSTARINSVFNIALDRACSIHDRNEVCLTLRATAAALELRSLLDRKRHMVDIAAHLR